MFSDDRALFRTLFTPIASLPVFPAKPKPEGLRCRSDPNTATASYVPAIVNREQFNPLLPRTPLRTTSLSDEEELRFSAVMADAIPTIANSYTLGKLMGAPYVPITPYLLALPLPVRLAVHYGEPMLFEGTGSEDDEVINGHVERVKERIAVIEKTLPEGVTIEPFLDRTKMVNNAIRTVETNLFEGALIVVLRCRLKLSGRVAA